MPAGMMLQQQHGTAAAACWHLRRPPAPSPPPTPPPAAGRGRRARLLLGALLLAAAAASLPRAAADVKVLSASVLGESPLWVRNRSADIVLDFRKADPHFRHPSLGVVPVRGQPLKVNFHIGYFHGNVAIVRYANRFVLAVRKMHFYKTLRSELQGYPLSDKKDQEYISWWSSKLSVCSVDSATLQPVACEDYDPRTWKECEWSQGFEGEGPEDPRLIVWPGKGLFMIFGSKPWPKDPAATTPEGRACEGPWAFQPWLVRLQPYSPPGVAGSSGGGVAAAKEDPWGQGIIRLQYQAPGAAPLPAGGLLKEKNWNPFIYRGKLLFSQQFDPHVVIEPSPNGTCTKLFETHTRVFRNLTSSPRGNTQAVLVPSAFSGEPREFYLGVVHAESNRAYANYFYKMQAHPPFRIYARSRPMPIINSAHPRNPVWKQVSFPMSLDLIPESAQVMVGYGSGDQVPRVRMMPWEEVAALFPVPRDDGRGGGGAGGVAAWKNRAKAKLRALLQRLPGSSSSSSGGCKRHRRRRQKSS